MTLHVVVLNSTIIDSCVSGLCVADLNVEKEGGGGGEDDDGDDSGVGVADLNVEEEGGGGGEEPGAQGEASQVALDGQALPPLAKSLLVGLLE